MAAKSQAFSAMTLKAATSFGIAAIALAMAAVVLFAPPVLGDGDTYWHLAAGLWIIAHGRVPHVDPFSYTMAGQPWIAHEWLSELIMAAAFRLGGWSGMMILFAIASGGTIFLLARDLRRWLKPLPLFLTLVVAISLMSPSLLARPHLLTLPIMEVWCAGLVCARADERAPPLRLLPLMVLWANLHGGFPVGLVLAALLGCEAAAQDSRQAKAWGIFVASATALTLLNPNGLKGTLFPLWLVNSGAVTDIVEWQPANFRDFPPVGLVVALVLYLMLVRGFRLPIWRFIIFAGLITAALLHVRDQLLVGVIGSLVIAPALGAFLNVSGAPAAAVRNSGIATFMVGFFLLSLLRLLHPLVRGDDAVTPMTALAHVPASLRAEPVFNDDALGGYLIFTGVKPFVDGRADLYGAEFMDRYQRSLNQPGPLFAEQLVRYRIKWALVSRDGLAAHKFSLLPGWFCAYRGTAASVYLLR